MYIETKELVCGYDNRAVTPPISINLGQGDITCILGPNGVGKTTFFKTLQGFLKPVGGNVYLDGKPISQWERKELAKQIAYVPQTQSQPFAYKVLDVVCMGRTVHMNQFSIPSRKDYLKCEEIMEKLHITDLKNKEYSKISGGERQMVLIARALAQEPHILMMDEPASSLDFGNQVRMLKQIRELASDGIGVVMITHSPEHAFACGGKVALFSTKNPVLYGDISNLLTEEILKEAYGVDVRIPVISDLHGHPVKTCVALMN